MKLILWDIDQTLIEGGGVSRRAYAAAFRRATGRELELPWEFDGRTELAAASGVLRAHGIDSGAGRLERFLDLIVEELSLREAELASQGRVLPGASEALTALGATPGVRQSVLTGNLRALATLKLTALRIDHHFDLRVGAYGDDGFERTDLPASAFDRTQKYLGHRHSGADTVIVGDTLRDVATARAAGTRAIAVATGTTPEAELRAAGADVVLTDLTDTKAVVAAILGPR
jgi:phosphoglycolate phosphatase-like HAD superfamily hydrolase